jgi:hypothetical protein
MLSCNHDNMLTYVFPENFTHSNPPAKVIASHIFHEIRESTLKAVWISALLALIDDYLNHHLL